jgi:hypothetical protein
MALVTRQVVGIRRKGKRGRVEIRGKGGMGWAIGWIRTRGGGQGEREGRERG